MKPASKSRPLPSKEEVLAFIRESPARVGKREIARAFSLTGSDRIALKALLRELEQEGLVERGRGRRLAQAGALPEVDVVEITGLDTDGELLGRPVSWRGDDPPPRIYVAPERRGRPALTTGDRVLARLRRLADGSYTAQPIRQITKAPTTVVGVFAQGTDGGRLQPTDRRVRSEFRIDHADAAGAKPGELVLAESLPGRRLGLPQARVVERLGVLGEARSISLIAIHTHDIPTAFTAEALAQAEAARPAGPEGRTDLRDLPLVTIDGADARDFDDAVWAEPDPDGGNPGGWHLVVAIADVAHYVRPGDALDRCARERGNSVYFPDRVVPMLPEALSNGLCSLKPAENRACLAVHIWIDRDGNKLRHRFVRGLMRSAARLTYEQVQAAQDGRPDDTTGPLREPVIAPLFGAFRALLAARERRGTIDLDLPERQVILGADGHIERIVPRQRLDSHRLIEDFMIAANVCAAETLEASGFPCMYRVHDEPAPEKLEALRSFLATFGYRLAKGQVIKARHFNDILRKAAGTPHERVINEVILRSQAQAVYSPENIGHFGLALRKYAHFTSPIRRYSDLLVHRGLISALGFGPDGLDAPSIEAFAGIGEHISRTERRAAAAERDAVDRYTSAFLASRVGAVFAGRITGVTRFGLFVTLDETGADGLVPVKTLPDDYYVHDEAQHALTGRRFGLVYRLGDAVEVRLAEANPVTGDLVFHVMEDRDAAAGRPDWRRSETRSVRRGRLGRTGR